MVVENKEEKIEEKVEGRVEAKVELNLDELKPATTKPTRIKAIDRVTSIIDSPQAFLFKGIIYGDPGVGKTVFCAQAPKVLILDVERGSRSLLNHPELHNTLILPVKGWIDIEEILWELMDGTSELSKQVDTVQIDTVSELQSRKLDEQLKKAARLDKNRNPYLPYQGDYKENTEILRRIVTAFTDLDKNLILVAHAKEQKDESTGRMYWRPDITPKLTSTLEGLMDLQGFMTYDMDAEPPIRRLQIMPSSRVKAKTRIGGLPPVLENPSFQQILDANSVWKKEHFEEEPEETHLQDEEIPSEAGTE